MPNNKPKSKKICECISKCMNKNVITVFVIKFNFNSSMHSDSASILSVQHNKDKEFKMLM